ncbi:MAG: hypothetical protein AAB557_02870 [Patescibacteria group bacterium]
MKRFLPLIILITLWLVFFWKQIVGGQVWYCCDNLLINIPARVFQAQELKDGRFPLTNPYIFSGTPFFADLNLSVLHPLNLLYLVMAPFRALTVGILLSFLVGSIGMYALGRTLRLSRFASLAGAIVFGFSGSLVVYANNIPILQVAALVPWVLAMWIRFLKYPTGKGLIGFVLIASVQILSGHPQLTYYTWLVLVGYSLYQKPTLKTVTLGLKAALFVLLLTSLQVVPFIKLIIESSRMGQDFSAASSGSVHPLSLLRLILPGIVGDLTGGTAWIQTGSMHGYVGFIPLLLLPFAWKNKPGKFFVIVSALSLFLAMGNYTPVYWLAYHLIPGIAWLREPAQFLFLWSFGMAGAVMVAMDTLMKKSYAARSFFVIGLGLLLGAAVLRIQGIGIWEQLGDVRFLPDRLIVKLSQVPWTQRTIITDGILYNLTLVGMLVILAALAIARLRLSGVAKMLVLVVLFADLFVYGQRNVTTISERIVSGWQEKQRARIASWKLSDTKHYRYYTDPVVYPYPYKKPFGQFNDPGESEWQFKILRPSLGMIYGIPAVDGYASMVLRSYQMKVGSLAHDPTGVAIPSIVDPFLPKVGVRYIITKRNNPLLTDTSRYTVIAVEESIAVYEDNKAVPITSVKESEQ